MRLSPFFRRASTLTRVHYSDVTDGDLKEIVFTVWDQNKHLQDDIIGQVVIPLDDIKDQQVPLAAFIQHAADSFP